MRYRRSRNIGTTYFFTIVTHERRGFLCEPENATLIMEAFEHVIAKRPFAVDAFVLLPDHIHCIWTLPENDSDYSLRWRLIKSFFTRKCGDNFQALRNSSREAKGEQGVWQRRFWEHTIKDDVDLTRHLDYIHFNPVKHGCVLAPKSWPYSSFHDHVRRGLYDVDWGADGDIVIDASAGME